MVSVLVRIFGSEHIQLAEDVVQEALLAALENWKYNGIPDNPKAWLYRTSRNKAIDVIRRKKHLNYFDFTDPEQQLLTSEYTMAPTMETFWEEDAIKDDFLGMMYACCHPGVSKENQVTFILKSLCGFSTAEVARAFLTSEDTISKRLYRTKEFFRKERFRPTVPDIKLVSQRTPDVLSCIYLMFNEGYHSTNSDDLIREDIIGQSFWLCKSLLDHPTTNLPEVNALMALMCFHAARMDSRVDENGEIVLLSEQDRSKWNRELIQRGSEYIYASKIEEGWTTYHLEAVISFEHCHAASFEETNWERIVKYYDRLLDLHYDPVVDLNRCIAILEKDGPDAAEQAIQKIQDQKKIGNYPLFYTVRASIHQRKNDHERAQRDLQTAINLTKSDKEKSLLQKRLDSLS